MDPKKSITVLNNLIEINNDRIEGYETAAKETEQGDLKALFAKLANTSHECNSELRREVTKLGGEPEEGTRVTGKFFRVWMDVKAALTGNDLKAILNSCEFGEDAAVKAYRDALKDDVAHLDLDLESLVKKQYLKIKADHDTVRDLRDSTS
ncbi:hypothetical protein P872_19760 [Rhodonellum psychrophilum GCM71 = DSM 17998]|uniref:DUF2383 domain-containing protein n=2 Tax=Rhodonellum TaxID=336827 RepID=U5BVS3_9BACT|nr:MULTISPECIES: PA2169 family four-helix-bundle protein [Rhodonellum]ERM81659.1 hypothetical protein P872_19760 [Rhodonellum psychrophilum GCM71 = DSM 17998]MDO9553406.1 PA2169 family four-helix-bundle protein [Rhodonellum sp.]SDZ39229.1 conserved hypothetical protein [Rhodonellum ikkaensis]